MDDPIRVGGVERCHEPAHDGGGLPRGQRAVPPDVGREVSAGHLLADDEEPAVVGDARVDRGKDRGVMDAARRPDPLGQGVRGCPPGLEDQDRVDPVSPGLRRPPSLGTGRLADLLTEVEAATQQGGWREGGHRYGTSKGGWSVPRHSQGPQAQDADEWGFFLAR